MIVEWYLNYKWTCLQSLIMRFVKNVVKTHGVCSWADKNYIAKQAQPHSSNLVNSSLWGIRLSYFSIRLDWSWSIACISSVTAEVSPPLGDSLLFPPWPGCAVHVNRSLPVEYSQSNDDLMFLSRSVINTMEHFGLEFNNYKPSACPEICRLPSLVNRSTVRWLEM